jgi:hypothetical protein
VKSLCLGLLFVRRRCSVIRGGGTVLVAANWLQGLQTLLFVLVAILGNACSSQDSQNLPTL